MSRVPIPSEDLVTWEFQVEQQGFITRYGRAGTQFFKQVVLQSGAVPSLYPVKRIGSAAYTMGKRFHLKDR